MTCPERAEASRGMIIYLGLMLPLSSSCLPNLALHQAGVYHTDCLQSVVRGLLLWLAEASYPARRRAHDFNLAFHFSLRKKGSGRCIFCCTCPKLGKSAEVLRTSKLLLLLTPVRSCQFLKINSGWCSDFPPRATPAHWGGVEGRSSRLLRLLHPITKIKNCQAK